MTASLPAAFPRASRSRRRAFGLVNALRTLGLLCLIGTVALSQNAHAQATPSDDATSVPLPTTVFHLSPESAAPTRTVLHERILTRLRARGEVLTPKEGEPIIRFTRRAPERAPAKETRNGDRKKYVIGRPTSVAGRQAFEQRKISDGALLLKVAKKSQLDPGLLSIVVASSGQIVNTSLPLFAELSPNQPADSSGRAYLTFISPRDYNIKKNRVTFQNHGEPFGSDSEVSVGTPTRTPVVTPIPTSSGNPGTPSPPDPPKTLEQIAAEAKAAAAGEGMFVNLGKNDVSSIPIYFTPTSCLHVELKAKKDAMYLVALKAYWGMFPYDPAFDALDDGCINDPCLFVICADSGLSGIADTTPQPKLLGELGSVKTIPGGTPVTSMVLLCDKSGWYDITVAGMSNPWDFRSVTIKEITF